jgi:hypothetical protein
MNITLCVALNFIRDKLFVRMDVKSDLIITDQQQILFNRDRL